MAVYGNTINGYWKVYLTYTLNNNYSATKASIAWWYGIYWVKAIKGNSDTDGNYQTEKDTTYMACTTQSQVNKNNMTARLTNTWYKNDADKHYLYNSGTFYITKKTTTQAITLKASINHKSSSATYKGTSTVSTTLTISALASYGITYNGNGVGTVNNIPEKGTKYYGINYSISSKIPTQTNWTFLRWNTASNGGGTNYSPNASYTSNAALSLYAQWEKVYYNPSLYNIEVYRVNENHVLDDAGDYICIAFDYASGRIPADGPNAEYVQTSISNIYIDGNRLTPSFSGDLTFTGVSSNKGKIYASLSRTLYQESESHPIIIVLSTNNRADVTINTVLSSTLYPIELSADGSLMALGSPTRIKQDLYLYINDVADVGTLDKSLYDSIDKLGLWIDIPDGGVLIPDDN